MVFPYAYASKHVKTDLQTLLLAVIPFVLFGFAVDPGDIFSASTLFFLSLFSVWKGGNHRKITIIIEDPVAGLQCRGAAFCPPFHFCHPRMIHFLLFILSVFPSLRHRFSNYCTTFLSCAIPLCSYFYVVKFYTVVPGKFHFSLFCFLAMVLSIINI